MLRKISYIALLGTAMLSNADQTVVVDSSSWSLIPVNTSSVINRTWRLDKLAGYSSLDKVYEIGGNSYLSTRDSKYNKLTKLTPGNIYWIYSTNGASFTLSGVNTPLIMDYASNSWTRL